ncbi:hypothetical protein PSE10C_02850 [Pseudomonas amygdali pv. eriobotryae]|nr:hypothetical protein PSE10C_02850 [Pseudomonas amygdali pv. eriobotryae]
MRLAILIADCQRACRVMGGGFAWGAPARVDARAGITEVTLLELYQEIKPICRLAYTVNPGWPMARSGGEGKVALTESLNRYPVGE